MARHSEEKLEIWEKENGRSKARRRPKMQKCGRHKRRRKGLGSLASPEKLCSQRQVQEI